MLMLKHNTVNLSCQYSSEALVLSGRRAKNRLCSIKCEKLLLPNLHPYQYMFSPLENAISEIPRAKYIKVMGMLAKEQIKELMQQLTPRDIGALMESLRRRVVKVCKECSKEFTGYVHQEYCSKRCQHRHYMREYMRRRRKRKMAVGDDPTTKPRGDKS